MATPGSDRPHSQCLNGCPGTELGLMATLESLNIIERANDSESSNSSSDLGPLELELSRLLSLHPERSMSHHGPPVSPSF
jgi:hypothetical protein